MVPFKQWLVTVWDTNLEGWRLALYKVTTGDFPGGPEVKNPPAKGTQA